MKNTKYLILYKRKCNNYLGNNSKNELLQLSIGSIIIKKN
jgi:hypothetical protein